MYAIIQVRWCSKILISIRILRPRELYGNKLHSKILFKSPTEKKGTLISWKLFDLNLNDYCKQRDIPKYQVACCILYSVKSSYTHTIHVKKKKISDHDKSEISYMIWHHTWYHKRYHIYKWQIFISIKSRMTRDVIKENILGTIPTST